ncbi:hypothetical protein V5799_000089 [Amblyomma americanum]|uniref:Uncharacterized protein n=1 Tax=Amblyomma americanum TaxID=6943 RepID=A0AAQ4D419_AMBAM
MLEALTESAVLKLNANSLAASNSSPIDCPKLWIRTHVTLIRKGALTKKQSERSSSRVVKSRTKVANPSPFARRPGRGGVRVGGT